MIRKCQIGTDVKVNSHQPRFFVSCLSLFSAFPASQKVWGLLWGLRFLKAVYACSFLSIYAEFWAYKNGDEGIRTRVRIPIYLLKIFSFQGKTMFLDWLTFWVFY